MDSNEGGRTALLPLVEDSRSQILGINFNTYLVDRRNASMSFPSNGAVATCDLFTWRYIELPEDKFCRVEYGRERI